MNIFEVKNLSFSYGEHGKQKVLDNINIEISRGEYVVLCGKSGCGKTTLLRMLKSMLAPHGKREGEILFLGKRQQELSQREEVENIGFVMQNPENQIVTDKVWHELAFGLESLGYDQKTMRVRLAEMVSYFGIGEWYHKDVAELSGGQKQLLNLASVMAMQPEVLILDEPTSQLDPVAASEFLNTVRKLHEELGITVIITEHRLEEVLPLADRVIYMEQGKVCCDGAPEKIGEYLYREKKEMFAAMPSAMQIYYMTMQDGKLSMQSETESMQAEKEPMQSAKKPMTVKEGRAWLDAYVEAKGIISEENIQGKEKTLEEKDPLLITKELWFSYEKKGKDILKGLSMEVYPQELHAIVGGNGAGKSTLLRVLCGIEHPYRGKVKKKDKNKNSDKNKIAMLPQDPTLLFVKKTVEEELLEMNAGEARTKELMELLQISELATKHPYDLSGGEQQKVGLAKVLLLEPEILLLDEPTKGMDAGVKIEFAKLLKELVAQGKTVLMVSHDIEFCARYAQRVSLMFDGELAASGTVQEFFAKNSFYTTGANRIARHLWKHAIINEDVVKLCGEK